MDDCPFVEVSWKFEIPGHGSLIIAIAKETHPDDLKVFIAN